MQKHQPTSSCRRVYILALLKRLLRKAEQWPEALEQCLDGHRCGWPEKLGDWLQEFAPCLLTLCHPEERQALECLWWWWKCRPNRIRWLLKASPISWSHSSLQTLDSAYSSVSLIHLQSSNPLIPSLTGCLSLSSSLVTLWASSRHYSLWPLSMELSLCWKP